jgi:RimJ/RimL family protein N-acetyltransferase
MLYAPSHVIDSLQIQRFDDSIKEQTFRFIDSWSADDVYDRFGCAGIPAQEWLVRELLERARHAWIAVNADRVIGLLDHVVAEGAIHIGIMVDPLYRKSSVGTRLVEALVYCKSPAYPAIAECRIGNYAAQALFRRCRFHRAGIDRDEIIWRHP